MKLIYAILAATLSVGAAFAGEDSSQRLHGTGPEWYEQGSALTFQDADSDPANLDRSTP